MKKLTFILLFCFYVSCVNATNINFNFYGENITINYDKNIVAVIDNIPRLKNDKNIALGKLYLEKIDHKSLLAQFIELKTRLSLSDWLYYELIYEFTNQSLKSVSTTKRIFFTGFLLYKSGFDVKFCYTKRRIDLYVLCDKFKYCLTTLIKTNHTYLIGNTLSKKTILSKVIFRENNKIFSLHLDSMPSFSNSKNNLPVEISFKHNEKSYTYSFFVNIAYIDYLQRQPVCDFKEKFNFNLSEIAYKSFLLPLKEELKGQDTLQAIRFLLSLVRTGFAYETATNQKYNIEMSPEELLYYKISDCEDKSALLYYLVKEILNLPIIVLQYTNHITIAVAFNYKKSPQKPIIHNGKKYYVCEPNNSKNDRLIGQYQENSQENGFEIIFEYLPKK